MWFKGLYYLVLMFNKYSILILLIIFSSCKKEEKKEVGSFKVANTLNDEVTVHLYPTKADFFNGANALATLHIKPMSEALVPLSDFNNTTEIYIDWYTDDYAYSYWPQTSSYIPLTPFKEGSYEIKPSAKCAALRQGFINGNAASTTWESTDQSTNTVNMTIRKDHSYMLNIDGKTTEGKFSISGETLLLTNLADVAAIGFSSLPPYINNAVSYPTRDTAVLYAQSPSFELRFIMVKQ